MIASSLKSYCICIVCPNQSKLIEMLAKTHDIDNNSGLKVEELSHFKSDQEKNQYLIKLLEADRTLVKTLTDEVARLCLSKHVARFEVPTKLKFVAEIWLPDTGLVTDSLKIKRIQIDKFYHKEIREIYV